MSKNEKNPYDNVHFGGHLGYDGHFECLVTLKSKNNHFNVISVLKLVENEVLHWILDIMCQKYFFHDGHRFCF